MSRISHFVSPQRYIPAVIADSVRWQLS